MSTNNYFKIKNIFRDYKNFFLSNSIMIDFFAPRSFYHLACRSIEYSIFYIWLFISGFTSHFFNSYV